MILFLLIVIVVVLVSILYVLTNISDTLRRILINLRGR